MVVAFLVPPPPAPPVPPPSITKEKKFTVLSTDGKADVFVSGLPFGASADQFRIGNSFMGPTGYDRTTSQITGAPSLGLTQFAVTGLFQSDEIALFQQQNYGTPITDLNWVKISGAMPVKVSNDQFTKLLASGKMDAYAGNAFIKIYPFGAMERSPSVTEADWAKSVKSTLDAILADALGQSLLKLLAKTVVIRPWVPNTLGAFTSTLNGVFHIEFSPQVCDASKTSSSPEEVLLHELIHVLENNNDGYKDFAGFKFDEHDFMTVNVVNVFSKNRGRNLRKDHFRPSPSATPAEMPEPWKSNPWQHSVDMKDDFAIAKQKHPALFTAVATGAGAWNPYWYFSKTFP